MCATPRNDRLFVRCLIQPGKPELWAAWTQKKDCTEVQSFLICFRDYLFGSELCSLLFVDNLNGSNTLYLVGIDQFKTLNSIEVNGSLNAIQLVAVA